MHFYVYIATAFSLLQGAKAIGGKIALVWGRGMRQGTFADKELSPIDSGLRECLRLPSDPACPEIQHLLRSRERK